MGEYHHRPLIAGTFDIYGELPFVDIEGRLRRSYFEDGIWKAQVITPLGLAGFAVNVYPTEIIRVRCADGESRRLMGVPWPA